MPSHLPITTGCFFHFPIQNQNIFSNTSHTHQDKKFGVYLSLYPLLENDLLVRDFQSQYFSIVILRYFDVVCSLVFIAVL